MSAARAAGVSGSATSVPAMNEPNEKILRTVDPATGVVREVELTDEQAQRLADRKALAWRAHNERILVDDDGTITERESGKPLLEE